MCTKQSKNEIFAANILFFDCFISIIGIISIFVKKVKFEDQYHEKVHFIYDERLVHPVGYFCPV